MKENRKRGERELRKKVKRRKCNIRKTICRGREENIIQGKKYKQKKIEKAESEERINILKKILERKKMQYKEENLERKGRK